MHRTWHFYMAAALGAWLAALPAAPARAAIAKGLAVSVGANIPYSGNGELFFTVSDPVLEASYTLDLGITMDDFFIRGQPDAGFQLFVALDDVPDTNWATFIGQANRSALVWAVMAREITGGTARGGQRLYTTLTQGQEKLLTSFVDNSGVPNYDFTNQKFSNDVAEARIGAFLDAVNASGTHGASGDAQNYARNGSSVNFKNGPGPNAYFGGAVLPHKPVSMPFQAINRIGESSWFYFITRSGGDQAGNPITDEFDNLGHDGYWGFTYVDPSIASPYAGKYLLSYTIEAASATATQREFANGIGRTEWSGGFTVTRLGAATSQGMEQPSAVFGNRVLGVATAFTATSPVPESGSAALLLAGLAGLVAARRMRRR